MTDSLLILGATGGQGGAVTDALVARGAEVKAVVRDAESTRATRLTDRGVQTVTGSLDDAASLAAAMDGVAGVFAVTTPFEAGTDAEVRQGQAVLAAAAEVGVPHLVFSSVAGATERTGVPHFDSKAVVERELANSGLSYTILAPTYFFDNALGGAGRIRDGVLELPLPSQSPLQQLARPDLGRFAAEVLLSPSQYVNQRIELASDAVTPAQMAEAFTTAIGRPVVHQQVPLADIDNADMHAMWTFLNGPGYQVDIPTLHATHPEIGWTDYTTWAQTTFGGDRR